MNMNKKIFTALISVVLMAGAVCADPNWNDSQTYYASDASPALRIGYSGRASCSTVVTGDSANIVITVDIGLATELATTLDASGAAIDTIAELAAAVIAVTNTAGKKLLEVDTTCVGATSETMDDELLVTTVTKHGPGWFDGFLWDTSDTKHYRVHIPPSGKGSSRNLARAKSTFGSVGGTGDITYIGYIDNTEVYRYVSESPVYVLGANTGGTQTGTVTISSAVIPGLADNVPPLDLVVGKDEGFVLSANRASSGTTGGLGIRFEHQ